MDKIETYKYVATDNKISLQQNATLKECENMPIIETKGIIKKHNDRKARILIPKEFNKFAGMEATITVELSPEQLTELKKTLSPEQLKKLDLKIKG